MVADVHGVGSSFIFWEEGGCADSDGGEVRDQAVGADADRGGVGEEGGAGMDDGGGIDMQSVNAGHCRRVGENSSLVEG